MRYLVGLFIISAVLSACIKKPAKNPIPTLTFESFNMLNPAVNDSAIFKIGYSDLDGDLFRNDNSDGPNTVINTYYYNADSAKFVYDLVFDYTITQPADGYYKGKAIQGDITIPVSAFRSAPSEKIVRFVIYMVDMQNNKSNVLTTPQFTIN